MANFRKSFNFRNGVKVDDDNLVVNSNGLVGIGTTVPTSELDVRGTAKVVGLVTSNSLYVSGIATISDLKIGSNITASSGVITATAFYGNGSTLSNLPTSQWVDVDVGLGFTSIYAQGNVGVASTDPRFTFQVGGNPNNGSGVGFNSTGNIKASGIITATDFYGTHRGRVKGDINSTGISTFTTLKVGTSIVANAGVLTATTFKGNLTGNVTGTATSASSLTGTPNINVGVVTATKLIADIVEVPNTGVTTVSKLLHVGTGGTALSALERGRIGIGTGLPTSELQIRKASGSSLEVISDSGQARISVGQSVGLGNSTGIVRFGNSDRTLDIINNDVGDIKSIIHAGTGAGSTGNFKWVYGQTSEEKMTLTYNGNLGINDTNPSEKLSVGGGVTVTGSVHIDDNLTVDGTITGTINYPTVISGTNLNTTAGVTTLTNLEVTSDVDFSGASLVELANVVIGTTIPDSYAGSPTGLTVNNTISANNVIVDDLISLPTGIVTAATVSARFNSSNSNDAAVQITVLTSPNRIEFSVLGVGSTTLQLF